MDLNRLSQYEALACLMFLLLGVLVGAAFGRGWSIQDMISGAAAVGTIAAAWIALWLGLKSVRTAAAADLLRGRIAAARVRPTLEAMATNLKLFTTLREFPPGVTPPEDELDRTRSSIEEFTKMQATKLGWSHITELAPLPGRLSSRLATAMGYFDKIESSIQGSREAWDFIGRGDRANILASMLEDLKLAQLEVESSRAICSLVEELDKRSRRSLDKSD